jgi:hypothetical protein
MSDRKDKATGQKGSIAASSVIHRAAKSLPLHLPLDITLNLKDKDRLGYKRVTLMEKETSRVIKVPNENGEQAAGACCQSCINKNQIDSV